MSNMIVKILIFLIFCISLEAETFDYPLKKMKEYKSKYPEKYKEFQERLISFDITKSGMENKAFVVEAKAIFREDDDFLLGGQNFFTAIIYKNNKAIDAMKSKCKLLKVVKKNDAGVSTQDNQCLLSYRDPFGSFKPSKYKISLEITTRDRQEIMIKNYDLSAKDKSQPKKVAIKIDNKKPILIGYYQELKKSKIAPSFLTYTLYNRQNHWHAKEIQYKNAPDISIVIEDNYIKFRQETGDGHETFVLKQTSASPLQVCTEKKLFSGNLVERSQKICFEKKKSRWSKIEKRAKNISIRELYKKIVIKREELMKKYNHE